MEREKLLSHDYIDHPPHYTSGSVEVIDIIEQTVKNYDPVLGWSVGQAIKYLCRAPLKGDLQGDLAKASWYLSRAISHAKGPVE